MPKYVMTVEIEAEQFLPDENKIPDILSSDGPRKPGQDRRSSWILRTEEGATYVKPGDYIIKNGGSCYLMPAEVFEANYKLAVDKPAVEPKPVEKPVVEPKPVKK